MNLKNRYIIRKVSPLDIAHSELTFPRIRGRGVQLAGSGGVMATDGASVKMLLEEPQGHPCWLP